MALQIGLPEDARDESVRRFLVDGTQSAARSIYFHQRLVQPAETESKMLIVVSFNRGLAVNLISSLTVGSMWLE